ncbi:MAG: HD domain-containing protein, partial [bacterium]|nr:HD domain-containing protein [bacterium]
RAIADHLHLINDEFRCSPRAARIFLDILRAHNGVAETLHTMHELGILGAYIPEFASIDCLVQYNRYHIYTADEHTLVAIESLERLSESSTDPARAPLKQVLNEIPRKELLYLAVLMHDVGKSARDDDHSTTGARMAQNFLERLGLSEDQVNAVVFLVQLHLTMSHISQRRDLSDTAMLVDFARQFKHPDRLRMLYLLTYADLSSVTRTAWTAWKSQLLRELYVKTFHLLTEGKKPVPDQTITHALVQALVSRFSRNVVIEHLNNLPPRYTGMNAADAVATHLTLIERLGTPPVAVASIRSGPFSELTICTRDKPYRLSEICGVLATHDINIFGAQAYTRTDGIVLDIFQVTSIDGNPEIESGRKEQIENRLAEVFQETVSVADLFTRHQQRWSRRRKPAISISTEVRFENNISDDYTVIDIFTQDAVGLLYKITRTLSDLGLDIYTARISTQADKAVDSFYVTQNSEKIVSADSLERIREELIHRIE